MNIDPHWVFENHEEAARLIESLQRERGALAAYVAELRDALEDMVIINEEDEDNVRLARAALEKEPTTSLAHLKARWQAEVLYEFTHGSYVMPATLNLAMSKRAGELRRQAEENPQ